MIQQDPDLPLPLFLEAHEIFCELKGVITDHIKCVGCNCAHFDGDPGDDPDDPDLWECQC